MSVMNPAALFLGNGRSISPQTATASVTGAGVDCRGGDYAVVVMIFGTVSAATTATIKIQHSTDDGSTDTYADISGATYTCTGDEDDTVELGSVRLHGKDGYLRAVYTETATNQSTVLAVAILPMKMQDYPGDRDNAFVYDVL